MYTGFNSKALIAFGALPSEILKTSNTTLREKFAFIYI